MRKLRVTGRHGFRRDLARFRTRNFAAAKKFRKFRSEIRCESHAISRAAACRRSAQLLGTSEGREQAAHHRAAWISARSRAISNEKFCDRENYFRKFRSEFRSKSHKIVRGTACRRLKQMLGTSTGQKEAAHHQAAWISARSRAISNAKFCGRENFRKFRSEIRPESHEISRGTAC